MPAEARASACEADRDGTGLQARSPPLITQFSAPRAPPALIERARLVERLRVGLTGPVTLLCAPAGSGKTALLSSGLDAAEPPGPVAWITLEHGDDDPARLWAAVLTALRLAGAVPDDSALAALAPPVAESRRVFMPLLVNALAELPAPVVLVLDDAHLLRSRECLEQLGFLLMHAPDTVPIVLSARADPALPLHLLRVRGHVTEVRAADLAFTHDEAAQLFAAHGLALSDQVVRALCTRTEGWGAGLRLAALGLQGRADPELVAAEFADDDRVVGDFLLAEVLDGQSATLRAFLLRTSIVDRVCGELADALTGETSGSDTLATLERSNGFVVANDRHGEWYRYHRLFASLLRTRLQRELPGELPQLHARAARWHAARRSGSPALRHAVAAADWELAVELVAEHWFQLFVSGQAGSIRALVDQLPQEHHETDAELAAVLACCALEAGDPESGERHVARAEGLAAQLPRSRRRRYLETMAIARLYAARVSGDFDEALAAADELLAEAATHGAWSDDAREALVHANLGTAALWTHRLERAQEELELAVSLSRAAGLDYVAVSALGHLGLLGLIRDGATRLVVYAREATQLAARRGWSGIPQAAPGHVALAAAAFSELRLDEAEEHLARALDGTAHIRERHLAFASWTLKARIQCARGQPSDGLQTLDAFEALHRRGESPDYQRVLTALLRARLLAAMGELDAAESACESVRGEPWAEVDVTRARLRLAAGEPQQAIEILRSVESSGTPAAVGMTAVARAALEAVAHDQVGDPARAGQALERGLAMAEATGNRWPFLDAGPRVEALLRNQIRAGTAHRAIVAELLDAFRERVPVRRQVAPLLEPLSEREQTILRYLPTALSNGEIASELFVTTNTVKTHLRSIYRKLDVARRREAVERARDLHLLASGQR